VQSNASILCLLLLENFEMILWGKKIEHHNIINDLVLKKQLTYKPTVGDGLPNGRGREQGHRGAPTPRPV